MEERGEYETPCCSKCLTHDAVTERVCAAENIN